MAPLTALSILLCVLVVGRVLGQPELTAAWDAVAQYGWRGLGAGLLLLLVARFVEVQRAAAFQAKAKSSSVDARAAAREAQQRRYDKVAQNQPALVKRTAAQEKPKPIRRREAGGAHMLGGGGGGSSYRPAPRKVPGGGGGG